MIEDESSFVVADEIVKTIEVRNQHGTTMRHRFERREPKRFPALGERRVNEKARVPIRIGELRRIKNRSGKSYLAFCLVGRTSKRRQIGFAAAAKFRLCRTNNH